MKVVLGCIMLLCFQLFCIACTRQSFHSKPNVILITVDALRSDHLSAYGYPRKTSPWLDTFAKDSYLFEDCICQVPCTGQSFVSLFTGKYPYRFGIMDQVNWVPIGKNEIFLPEILKEAGYYTTAFLGGDGPLYFLDKEGTEKLLLGFDTVHLTGSEVIPADKTTLSKLAGIDIGGNLSNSQSVCFSVIEFINSFANSKKPYFFWLHLMDTHSPYVVPSEWENFRNKNYQGIFKSPNPPLNYNPGLNLSIDDKDYLIDCYDDTIRYLDYNLQVLFGYLQRLNELDNTIIVFTADHGESL